MNYLQKGLLAYSKVLDQDKLDILINKIQKAVDIFYQYGRSILENKKDRCND